MSVSKRRKRARNRRKKKWLKKARKIQLKYARELQHSDLLSKFQSYIDEEYKRGEIALYRWAHNPYTADDFTPQIFQSFSTRDINDIYIPPVDDNKKRIKGYVEYFTLSHFMTEQQAIDKYKNVINNLLNSDHPEKVKDFMENKGQYVQRCKYGENDVLYGSPNAEGHVNVLPCMGLDPDKVIDTTYTPVKIV